MLLLNFNSSDTFSGMVSLFLVHVIPRDASLWLAWVCVKNLQKKKKNLPVATFPTGTHTVNSSHIWTQARVTWPKRSWWGQTDGETCRSSSYSFSAWSLGFQVKMQKILISGQNWSPRRDAGLHFPISQCPCLAAVLFLENETTFQALPLQALKLFLYFMYLLKREVLFCIFFLLQEAHFYCVYFKSSEHLKCLPLGKRSQSFVFALSSLQMFVTFVLLISILRGSSASRL